jgi:hypothetical protein
MREHLNEVRLISWDILNSSNQIVAVYVSRLRPTLPQWPNPVQDILKFCNDKIVENAVQIWI